MILQLAYYKDFVNFAQELNFVSYKKNDFKKNPTICNGISLTSNYLRIHEVD